MIFKRTMSTVRGPMEQLLRQRVTQRYSPTKLEIENESHKHRHHAPMQGVDSQETHFKVTIVSEEFASQSRIERQRGVYQLFKDEMKMDNGIHALSLICQTPPK